MSVFAANKKYLSLAMQYMHMAQGVQEEQQDIDFGRQLLTNIRQMRIQQSAMDIQSQGREGVANTGFIAARQSMQTQFTQPYQQSTEDYERQEEIAELQAKANQALKKYKKQAKTARTTGYITSAVLAVAGGFLAAGAVAAGAAAAGTVATSTSLAIGAGVGGVAGGALGAAGGAAAGADRNYMGGAVSGTIAGTSIAMAGTAFMGGAGGAVTEASGGTITTQVGNTTTVGSWASAPTTTAAASGSWTASQWLAAGKIVSTIGGAVKDINNYEVKLPVSQAYTGQNYSQYVQSFRGFA
jgi:hypothetical protein